MKFALQHSKELKRMYIDEQLSAKQIAEELGTYPNMILRALRYLDVDIRGRSDAQKIYLSKNDHPKKGTKISAEAKTKIGKGHLERWKNMDDETRQKISEQKKQQWYNMSDEERAEMQSKAHKAIRQAAENGSRLERDICSRLEALGYNCFIHDKHLIGAEKMEIDILIPSVGVAIEVDGVSHFENVWGDERLAKQKDSDNRKNGLIIMSGYCMVRIKNRKDKYGAIEVDLMVSKIVDIINKISVKMPGISDRIFEVDV